MHQVIILVDFIVERTLPHSVRRLKMRRRLSGAALGAAILIACVCSVPAFALDPTTAPRTFQASRHPDLSPHGHRGPLARTAVPHDGPRRFAYGFQTTTHRWGWFGAERYYPRSFSHRGYYGDAWHWAYRRGY